MRIFQPVDLSHGQRWDEAARVTGYAKAPVMAPTLPTRAKTAPLAVPSGAATPRKVTVPNQRRLECLYHGQYRRRGERPDDHGHGHGVYALGEPAANRPMTASTTKPAVRRAASSVSNPYAIRIYAGK